MMLVRFRSVSCALAVVLSGGIVGAQPGPPVRSSAVSTPAVVPEPPPVEVGAVVVTPAGVSATLVNRSRQAIAGYLVGLTYSTEPDPQQFEAITSNWGAQWAAGREVSMLLSPRPSDQPARVIVRAVVLADGTGYGDRETVARIRADWDRRRSGLSGALALLDRGNVPATEEELQALIDQIALTMARVPVGRNGESVLQPYLQAIAGLKHLQGREMTGTDRLAREIAQIADTLQLELAAVPGAPATAAR